MWGTIIIYIIQYFMCTYGDDLRGLGPGTWQLWLGVRACAVRRGNLTQCGFVFVHIVRLLFVCVSLTRVHRDTAAMRHNVRPINEPHPRGFSGSILTQLLPTSPQSHVVHNHMPRKC